MLPDPDPGAPPDPEAFFTRVWALAAEAQQFALTARDHRAAVEAAYPGLLAELAPPPPVVGVYRPRTLRN